MAPRPGGGGLVILPHKSWNVWNRDNKAKVARDEKAHKQLIEAKQKCRNKVLQQIKFERLNGKNVSKQEEEERIEYALDNMNITDYIKDESMQQIAQNMNDKMERENTEKKRNKKRRHKDDMTEQDIKYQARKRHKRNDVSIIEDHYNEKSQFQFDPNRYHTNNDKYSYKDKNKQLMDNNNNNNDNSHFTLFNEEDLKNENNENGYNHPDRIKAERKKKEMEDYQYKFGRTEIECRDRIKRPWYLMTNQRVWSIYILLIHFTMLSLHRVCQIYTGN